jgi:hypothetical protein
MRTVSFLGCNITRLILGDNPFNGYSYIEDIAAGAEMAVYYTKERILKTLFEAEKLGINAMLPLACPKMLEILPLYYDKGGTMKIIWQHYGAEPAEVNLEKMMKFKPLAIYHAGPGADNLVEAGREKTVIDTIKLFKSAGVPAGLGTHVPETILRSENEGWGADFYMACLYNARNRKRDGQKGYMTGKATMDLVFYPDDRFLMYKVIKEIKKPCIAFKIFAGGQIFLEKKEEEHEKIAETMLREVYSEIKKGDITAVGVFQRDKEILELDVKLVNKVLAQGKS